jgi:hypothetical protein
MPFLPASLFRNILQSITVSKEADLLQNLQWVSSLARFCLTSFVAIARTQRTSTMIFTIKPVNPAARGTSIYVSSRMKMFSIRVKRLRSLLRMLPTSLAA